MERLEALKQLQQLVDESEDEQKKLALLVLVGAAPPIPPSPLGVVAGEVQTLAHQFYRTGSGAGWETPPRYSEAMERLCHRLTCVLESFLQMMEDAA